MNKASVPSIAIVGAALKFPGAVDPASFHELVVSGRRMFSTVPRVIGGPGTARATAYSREAVPASYLLRAALLDYPMAATRSSHVNTAVTTNDAAPADGNSSTRGHSGSDERNATRRIGRAREFGFVTARHLLAAETAASALADVPASVRPSRPGRTGAIIADTPEPGAPDIEDWVRDRLGLTPPDGTPPVSCSLRAIALACDMLIDEKLDLALAGGVSVGVDPAWHAYRFHLGAPAGEDVRVYDSSPTGGLPGEGCGVAALMRATDARDAGLPVYAEIAGWHAGDDVTAQSDAIRDAYLRANIDPTDVQFIEGHGAATAVEDLAELTALLDVLAPRHDGTPARCALGSVAANIGDTRAAAGAAALLKTALAMTAGVVPPTTGCVRPHHLLRAGTAPFRLPGVPEPWPETATRLAAVNSLGAADFAHASRSGPVHVVLRREREPRRPAGRRRRIANLFRDTTHTGLLPRTAPAAWPGPAEDSEPAAVSVLTAPSPRLPLDDPDIAAEADGLEGPDRPHVAEGASGGGVVPPAGAQPTVVAVRGVDGDDLAVMLDAVAVAAERLSRAELRGFALKLAATPAAPTCRARAAIVAADPGQLAERARRGAAMLRANPDARTAGTGIYLSADAGGRVVLLFPGLASTAVEHSAVLSASMATLDAAERIGVHARAAVGYSFGEVTGLAWAGAITFGEAARFAAHRAQVIRAMSGRTAMARVLAGPGTVTRLCDGTGLTLAAQEGPGQHVVAGPVSEIRDLPQRAALLDADVALLNTTHALHSPAMASSVAPMRAAVAGLRFTTPRRRLVSTVTGLDVTGPEHPCELLASQLARPALLAGALALACADADLVLLTARDPSLADVAGGGRVPVVQAPLGQRSGLAMTALAAFYAAGAIESLRPYLPSPDMVTVQAGGEPQSPSPAGEDSPVPEDSPAADDSATGEGSVTAPADTAGSADADSAQDDELAARA